MNEPEAEAEAEPELDQLFQLPLSEFTAARNSLSSKLKKSGDDDAAAEVRSMAKPSVSAWAVNQLYWRQRDLFDALITAADGFRAVEQHALGGGGSEALASAEQTRRHCLQEARAAIETLLQTSGHTPSPAIMHRVTTTLDALASYGNASPVPLNGRLRTDLEPPGFAALAALARSEPLPLPEASANPETKDPRATSDPLLEQRRHLEEQIAHAQEQLEASEIAQADAEATLRRDEMRARDADQELESARAYLDRTQVKVQEAATRLEEARFQLERAKTERTAAASKLTAARESLEAFDKT